MSFKALFTIFLCFFICQTFKMVIYWNQYRKVNLWVYFEDGGMPSTSATVLVSLVTVLFYEQGLSLLFIASFVIAGVLISDSMKVKREQGIQSELMAKFIDFRDIFRRKMTESTGHTPEDVFIGGILGFLITSVLYAF